MVRQRLTVPGGKRHRLCDARAAMLKRNEGATYEIGTGVIPTDVIRNGERDCGDLAWPRRKSLTGSTCCPGNLAVARSTGSRTSSKYMTPVAVGGP